MLLRAILPGIKLLLSRGRSGFHTPSILLQTVGFCSNGEVGDRRPRVLQQNSIPQQQEKLKRLNDEIRKIFERDRPHKEKQKLLDELTKNRKSEKFRLQDIATILQSAAKCGLRINFQFYKTKLIESTEKMKMIDLSKCIYGLKRLLKNTPTKHYFCRW